MPKAPRKCPTPGCQARITTTRYCPGHTPVWQGSTWTRPRNWAALREQILERDHYTCYLCGKPGADTVDHILAQANGGTNHPSNLAAVHDRTPPHCHRAKTSHDRWPSPR